MAIQLGVTRLLTALRIGETLVRLYPFGHAHPE
jgi:hypothetical protein